MYLDKMLAILLLLSCALLGSSIVIFEERHDYYYTYSSKAEVFGLHNVSTIVQMRVRFVNSTATGDRLHQLYIDSFFQRTQDGYAAENPLKWNLDEPFLFTIKPTGLVDLIYHNANEKEELIILKKALASSLSANVQLQDAESWQYKLNETDHTGEAEQSYEVSRVPDGILLRRQHRSTRDVERHHDKTMKIHHMGHIEHVLALDRIMLKDHTDPEKRQHLQRQRVPGERIIKEDITGSFPDIETKSTTEVVLKTKRKLTSTESIQDTVGLKGLTADSIEVPKEETVHMSLEEANPFIRQALSCIHNHTGEGAIERIECVVTLRQYLEQLSPTDMVQLGERYLKHKCQENDSVCQADRHLFIDLIIQLETKEAQQLLVQHVLNVVDPHEEEVQRTMYHMHAIKKPTLDLISSVAKLCFGPLGENIGKHSNITKNEKRACLAIGSLARYVNETNHLSAAKLVEHLENWLEHHDEGSLAPPQHRGKRSPTFFNKTEHHHKFTKMVLLEAVGNAGSPTSLDHILSYAKPNMGHPAWRRTAVNALRSYTCHKSATALIDLAVNDDIDVIRDKAFAALKKHPKHFNMTREQHNIILGKQYTYHTVMRLKRGFIEDIFKALSFKIEVPGIQWSKEIGNSKIGASFGLEARNKMELKLGLLSSFFDLYSYNTAFAEAHIGLLRLQVDVFKALACYHGYIEYDLNVLKDFGINDSRDLAKLFDKVIDTFRRPIAKSINTFKKIVSLFKGRGLQGLFNDAVKAIKNLPDALRTLLENLEQFVCDISDYEGLPWIAAMKEVVRRVRHFVEDVQSDILGFYNAIVDTITVNFPFAAKTTFEAIKLILRAVKAIFNNPMGALSNIGSALMKLKLSVSMIIGAKVKIEESCFFLSGKMPYWMNLGEEFTDLMEDIKDARKKISQFLESVRKSDETGAFQPLNVGKRSGIPTVEEQEVRIIKAFFEKFDKLLTPFADIVKTSKPFLDSYNAVMEVVHEVKWSYLDIRNMVEKGKSIVMKLFGPKFHRQFPSRRSDCEKDCGCGIFPYEGKNRTLLPGIDVIRKMGSKVSSPVTGIVKRRSDTEVLIAPYDRGLRRFEIIISNIEPIRKISNSYSTVISAGDEIGKALTSRCDPNFIHVAMRKKPKISKPSDADYKYIDPTPYIDKIVPVPRWVPVCNQFSLIINLQISDLEPITDPENAKKVVEDVKRHGQESVDQFFDETPDPETPWRPKGMDESATKSLADRFRGTLGSFGSLDQLADFTSKKKPPSILDQIDINALEVRQVLFILNASKLFAKQHTVERYVEDLAEVIRTNKVEHPENFSPRRLRYILKRRGQDSSGSFKQLVLHYTEIPEGVCPNIKRGIARGFGHFCTPHRDCHGLTCGLLVKFILVKKVIKFDMRLNTCSGKIDIQIDDDVTSFDIQGNDDVNIMRPFGTSGDFTLKTTAQFNRIRNGVYVTSNISVCSAFYPTCMETIEMFKNMHLGVQNPAGVSCNPGVEYDGTEDRVQSMALQYFVDDLLQMNIGKRREVLMFMNELRTAVLDAIMKNPGLLLKIGKSEFPSSVDFCFDGVIRPLKYYKQFFGFDFRFVVGPLPLKLGFGAGGEIGVRISAGACLMCMKAKVTITPYVAGKVWGSLEVNLGILSGGIRIEGFLLDTSFPITGTIGFGKFPINVRAKMDLVLVPLKVRLSAYVHLKLLFVTVTVFDHTLWKYKMDPIRHNIFDKSNVGRDNSPPDRPNCTVKQLGGQDYTDPAFILEAASCDSVSDVKLHYAIGSHPGGTDVSGWTEMGGSPLTVSQKMVDGIPLYFTVKAINSQGLEAISTCKLETYDVTPPDGRLEASHAYTSHPHRISGTLTIFDDSPLEEIQYKCVGFGQGPTNAEVVNWLPFYPDKMPKNKDIENELSHFSVGRIGKLTVTPIESVHSKTALKCAKACLDLGLKCVSFDYNFNTLTCDLHKYLEGTMAKLVVSGAYHNFERIGMGHSSYLVFDSLNLQHGEVYYINTRIRNKVGYTSIISSKGTLVDFTPPEPGPIGNASVDIVKPDGCSAAVTQRCIDVTWHPNHRLIIDGEGSNTVFNGHHAVRDTKYTLANHYLSANWDGFHDNETGIWGYTWAAGSTVCGTDVQPYDDPHSHLSGKSFWTHNGLAKHLHLPDGLYYVTVQALNSVHHGGSLVTTVCHSTPIIVDTTKPVFSGINDIVYDEDFDILAVYYNVSDSLSGIMRVDLALGKTKYDAKIRPFSRHDHIERKHAYLLLEDPGIPDGIPAWIRVRAINNVELFTTGHSDEPIMIDRSEPIAGDLFDGKNLHVDIDYQANNNSICVHWKGFYDPESGIDRYTVQVGSAPGTDDVVKPLRVSHSVKETCMPANLTHNSTYYTTLTALNHGLNPKSINRTSDGILIDLTTPVAGWAVDGLNLNQNIDFSAETATVSSAWDGFYDPESGIDHYEVIVIVNNEEVDFATLKKDQHFEEHTFSLEHGDTVKTIVRGKNGAGQMSAVTTDGYFVDLTPPVLNFISQSEEGLLYQSSDSYIHARWQYDDQESGILEYRVTVFQSYHGQKQRFWPYDQRDKSYTMEDGEKQFIFNKSSLKLDNGAKYSLHVTAINRALLSANYETKGVTVDTTPPVIKDVHVGLFEEEEELDELNRVLHVDSNGIEVSWVGHDGESGIVKYMVGIGVNPGDVSVTGTFIDFGSTRHGYVKARLNATASSGYTYYVTVIAFNGAGLESHPKSSRPIFVLKDNVPGIVFDGRQFLQDANSQRDTSSIACSFVGFESEACGITAYEWAIGSEPGFSDIRDYSSIGIVMANESAGFAQTNLDLPDGQTIYTAVRARTGHKCHEDFIVSVSDGIVTDASAPDISFQQIVEGIPQVPRRVLYTASSEKIVPMWNFSDTGSGVAGVTWTAGTLPGLSDRVPVTYAMTTGVSTGAITVNHGETIFVSLTATDNAGNQQIVTSPAVLIDTTPPVIQNFRCTDILSPLQTTIYCNWTPIDDTESDLKRVQIAVGLDYFKDDLAQFSDLGIYKSNWMFVLDSSNVVYNLTSVFVTLKTENVVNLTSVSVAKILLDSTPPLTGYVHITTSSAPKDTVASHPKCQVSETYVDVLWDQFLDPESGIERYEVAVGSYFQGTDIIGFKDVGLRTSTFIDGLALPSGGTVYASVRGFNKGGLYAIAVSAGVVVSPHPHLTVMDGNGNIDIDFQTELTTVLAQWDYQDPCPLQEVLWSVVRVDGVVIKPPSLVPSSDQFLIIDGVDLENDKTYYSVVTVVDAINRTQTARSDGFTVNIEPPFPGYVADGLGEDINYQRSTTKLSANWGSFGDLSSNDPSQIIEHYEVAVGNDRRYSLSRANVHGFVNVGIATNHTFNGLNLTAKSITYYVTVRAYSEAGSMAEASSNGIKVGFEAFIKPGFVFSKSSQSSTEELHAYWEGFSSDLPILDYQVGVSSNANFVASLSNNTIVCENVYSQDGATFDVTMKSVGVDMSVKLSDLSLRHGTMYFVVVKATDAAGNCGIATSPPILIDTTPPLPGKIVVGLKGTDAMYTVSTETLIATWPGFRDTETHIAMYEVSLFQRPTCSSKHLNKSELALMQGPVEVKNDTSIEFTRVQLLPRVPYYIKLTAYNEARLQITQWSDPVFVDETPPFPGDVKHGSDWKTSSLYQASTTTLQGMIGIAHDAATALCPSSKRIHFTNLVPNGMHALKTSPQTSDSPQTYYQTANVQTKSDQLVLITGHDEYSFHLELAGVKSELSPDVLGNFSFFLQAAEGETIITSVTLSKGDNDEIFAFEEPVIVNPPSSEMFQNASIEFHSDSSQPDMNNGTEKNITEIHQNTNASVLSNITTNGLKSTDQNVTDKNNSAEIRTNNHKAIFSNITVNVSEHVVNNKTDKNNSTDLSSNNDTVNYNITSNGLDHVVNNEADKKNSTELSFNNNTIYYNITSEGSEQAVNNGTDKNNTKEIHPNNKNAIHLDITSNRSENTSGNGTDIINSSEIHENTEIALQRNITNNGSNVISQVSYAPGIGLHIVGHAYGAKKKWFCLFWCTNEEGRKSEWVELPFDPTTKAATYTIQIEKEEYPTRTSWSAKLHINSGLKAVLYNIIKPNGYLKIRTWSINDFVPEVPDAFHPFKTQATLNYFEIPRPTNKPCHLGRTFYDFESKLNALWVGVGSSDNLVADVIPLHLYKHFCSPCQYQCDMTCSTDCPHSSFELTEIRLNNLTLDSKRRYVKDVMNTDSDKPNAATYFMIIKTVNHAGLGTTVSSKGITIDTTPPRCTLIQCLDPSYSMEEPVEYAGTNESIGAYWDCEEDVSDIITYDVAVGTHHGQQDIIPFHSVGLKDKLVLSNFTQPLQQLHTYYISVRANNAAGQSTIVTCHVTIDSKQPDVAGIKETVKPPGVTQLPDMPDVYLTINQHGAGLEWARGSDTLAFYEWQIGSADGDSDIFPLSKIGVTNSTKIAISDGKLVMDNVDASMSISAMANHSASDKSTEDLRQESFFSMEPGRCLYQSLIATSKAHKSSSVANITSCIKRPKDSLSVLNQERVNLVLSKEVSVTKETSDNALQLGSNNQAVAEGDVNVYVKGENGGVLAGLLSVDDVQVHYGSAASSTFSSYIQDPVNTNNEVSRTLFKRFRGTTDTSFFVSPVGHAVLTDNLEVEASFKPDSVQQGLEPVLIYWNTETRRWHQVNEDCDIDQRVSYSKNTISARVCSLNQPGRTARRKRSTGTEIAPTQFAVVIMSPGIENNPPKLVTTELYLMEDQKDFQKQLEFSDSENDQVYFEVVRPPRHGYANISAEGLLMYIPEKDFNGLDTVTVKMKEVPPSVKNFRPYVVTSEVKLHVNATNDPAVVSFLNLGHNSATQFLVSTTYNIAVEGKTDLKHVGDLILTDPDKNEQLQFIINHPMAENYTLVMQDINKNAPEEQVFQTLGTLGSVKVRKVYINSSRHFHGEVAFNVTGKDGRKRSPYAPLVSFHIFVLANPCEYGQCVGLGQDANCTSFDRASSFDGYECVCDAGYSGERCETEMEKGTKCRCPTFYDCIDEEDHYYCVLSPWKLPVTCVFLLLAAVLLLAGGYRLSKKWTSKVKVIPVRENPTADTIELNEVMRWQDETDKSISPVETNTDMPSQLQEPDRHAVYVVPGEVQDLETEEEPEEDQDNTDNCSTALGPSEDAQTENGVLQSFEPTATLSGVEPKDEIRTSGMAMLTSLMAPVGAIPRPELKMIHVKPAPKPGPKQPKERFSRFDLRPKRKQKNESTA